MKKEKKKERHIVSWSQEEDDILREQIHLHGSENWAIIASKFKDKTTRQCRRRWFTYLNSDFKKGGWSPEEDILLCEAQRMYGNRWTEIAKVVSGRTDNAVKNRFTTLCKKRAKAKLNSTTSFVNLNNKRVILRRGLNSEQGSKKIRACISSITEIPKEGERSGGECGAADQSVENGCLSTFLDKDDPKVQALMQQSQLLSSVAIKVNMDTTDQSVQSAWMVLEDFLKQNKESGLVKTTNKDTEFRLEKFNIPRDNKEECDAVPLDTGHVLQEKKLDQHCLSEGKGECHMASTNEVKTMPTDVKAGNAEFSSPTHVTPLFRTLAAAIPTPEFSESEKHFLMKTLGLESTSPGPTTNPSPPPTCKRSLLHCL